VPLSPHTYLAFVAAVVVLCIVPGPDMAYLLGRTVAQGRRAGLVAAVGINAGGYAHVTAAVLGLSAILATSSVAFTVVKIAGAGYLMWIGIRTITSAAKQEADAAYNAAPASMRRIFVEGFLSDALNPKVAIFFLAFLPQFVDRSSGAVSVPVQLLILGVTCNVIAISINVVIVCLASAVTGALRARNAWKAWLNRLLGGLFVALGLRLAAEKL
jgi:threonine/homoserine/homoserine lactone efflux protein